MATPISSSLQPPIVYPESDGKPMAENTLQFQWIVTIKENLEAIYRHDLNVFVAGDLFWYPVEGKPAICQAPDTLVAFGRPKGFRGSYRQWEEGGIAPQVVFEMLSPGNRHGEMVGKFRFNEKYGVEEYYVYDPDHNVLEGWRRAGNELVEIPVMNGWVSPRLGIRFHIDANSLRIDRPDGTPFLTFVELEEERTKAREVARQAEQRAGQAEQRAGEAEQRTGQAEQRASQAEKRAERLAEKLRQMGVDPNGG